MTWRVPFFGLEHTSLPFPSMPQMMLHPTAEVKCLFLEKILQDFHPVVHPREEGWNRATLILFSWASPGKHQGDRSGRSGKSSVKVQGQSSVGSGCLVPGREGALVAGRAAPGSCFFWLWLVSDSGLCHPQTRLCS